MSIAEHVVAARKSKSPQALLETIPYLRAIGISAVVRGDTVVTELAFDQHIIGDLGAAALQGGAISTLLEGTAILALLWEVESIRIPETMNVSVEYLGSGRPKPTFARAEIIRHGHQIANVRTIAWQDDEEAPIAASHAHFHLVPAK